MDLQKEVLKALHKIKKNGPKNRGQGICLAVHQVINKKIDKDELDLFLKELFQKWPKFSGDKGYPIPSPHEAYTACGFYNEASCTEMWCPDYPYAALRWELLDFMISHLSKE